MIDVQPLRRRLPALWIVALLALACCGTALAAAGTHHHPPKPKSKLAGKWKGSYSGAVSGHFTIHWKQTGSQLHGTIHALEPEREVRHRPAASHKGKIKFGAVSVGAKYKGEAQRDDDVRHLDEPAGRRQLERQQVLLTVRGLRREAVRDGFPPRTGACIGLGLEKRRGRDLNPRSA